MANLYLNTGISVNDIFKNLDKEQLKKVEKASESGFSTSELRSLEEDGIDVSLIKDNASENQAIQDNPLDSEQLKELKEKLKGINKDILKNSQEIRKLETDIIGLEEKVNENFEKLIDKQKDIEEEQKEKIKEAEKKELEKYTSSEGKITKEDFESNLSEAFDEIDSEYGTQLAKVAKDFAKNDAKMASLNEKIDTQNDLIDENDNLNKESEDLTEQINQLSAQEAQARAAAAAAAGGGGGGGYFGSGTGGNPPEWIKNSASPELLEAYNIAIANGQSAQEAEATILHYNNASAIWNSNDANNSTYINQYVAAKTENRNADAKILVQNHAAAEAAKDQGYTISRL